jgi:hypothetical protein
MMEGSHFSTGKGEEAEKVNASPVLRMGLIDAIADDTAAESFRRVMK